MADDGYKHCRIFRDLLQASNHNKDSVKQPDRALRRCIRYMTSVWGWMKKVD